MYSDTLIALFLSIDKIEYTSNHRCAHSLNLRVQANDTLPLFL